MAKFELSWGLMHLMARKDPTEASKVLLLLLLPTSVFCSWCCLIRLVLVGDIWCLVFLFLLRRSIPAMGQRYTLLLLLVVVVVAAVVRLGAVLVLVSIAFIAWQSIC